MPEGHVLHRLARVINRDFATHRVGVSSPQGRFAQASAQLDRSTLIRAEAVGKHLLIDFWGERTVWIHLGLIGKMRLVPVQDLISPQTLRLRIVRGDQALELRGPQWCRLITPVERAGVLARCGPDPIRPDADPERAWARVSESKKAIGQVLMDQAVFAGVGNIFRAEVLYRHRIDPEVPANLLPREVFDSIWADLVALMSAAVEVGRIDTVAPEHTPEAMGRTPRVDAHGGEVYVYRRLGQDCLVCGSPVVGEDMAGRSLYRCPTCQPAGSVGSPLAGSSLPDPPSAG